MHNLPVIATQRVKPIGSTTASDSSNAAHFPVSNAVHPRSVRKIMSGNCPSARSRPAGTHRALSPDRVPMSSTGKVGTHQEMQAAHRAEFARRSPPTARWRPCRVTRLFEVTGGDALGIEDRDQHIEAPRPACVESPRGGTDDRAKPRSKTNYCKGVCGDRPHE
jgi:hypothetical protein